MQDRVNSYNQSVIAYYDQAEVSYRDIWDLDRSMALHYGYRDHTVKTFPESLLKMNQVLASALHPASGSRILDAGCGVGGSSIFLAKHHGCRMVGISLSEKQVASAKANAAKNNLADKCTFLVADYTKTGFDDHSFDAVWALESVCHATDKQAFLKEAARLLRPGGKLVVADGFRYPGLDKESRLLIRQWLDGWSIHDLETIENMKRYAEASGFGAPEVKDLSPFIMHASRRMFRFGMAAKYYGKFRAAIGKKYGNQYTKKNTVGAICQYRALKKKAWHYCLFLAEKKR